MKPPLKRSRSAPDGGDEETQEQLQDQVAEGSSMEEEEKTDNATLLRLLEDGEKVRACGREGWAKGLVALLRDWAKGAPPMARGKCRSPVPAGSVLGSLVGSASCPLSALSSVSVRRILHELSTPFVGLPLVS